MDIQPAGNKTQTNPVMTDHEAPSIPVKQIAAPAETVSAVQKSASVPTMEQVAQAVKTINKSMQSMSQDLEFSVDTDTHRTVVKVIDQNTKEVIRQMPTEEALEIAKALDRAIGMIINQHA